MIQKVSGETPFKAIKNSFTVDATSDGYTLCYAVSSDSEKWTAHTSATPADEVAIVNGVTPFTWFKLSGNTDEEVTVIL